MYVIIYVAWRENLTTADGTVKSYHADRHRIQARGVEVLRADLFVLIKFC